jgi:hypothetical protein
MRQQRPPIVFLNIGWMKNYSGETRYDRLRGNFGWLKAGNDGHEIYNFRPAGGRLWGHRSGGVGIDLTKLGAKRGEQSIGGVLAVWFARDPDKNKAVVVGWYDNATVYRHRQTPSPREGHRLKGIPIDYWVVAKESDCHLVQERDRGFPIPSKSEVTGGYGQSPNWYGPWDGGRFLGKVWDYVQQHGPNRSTTKREPPKGSPRNPDPGARKEVETVAIDTATSFYESAEGGGRTVKSVEGDCLGWDLEAEGLHDKLLVEVKGLSGGATVGLTPNEYAQLKRHKAQKLDEGIWVLFIVTGCPDNPMGFEIRYKHDARRWEASDRREFAVVEAVAAIVRPARLA